MSQSAKTLPPPLAVLLGNAAWTRRLARGLIGSEADDVVQDTWVAAMRRPPDCSKPVRPWLATVIRNAAFNRSRDRARRLEREARTEAPSPPGTAEELLARLEVHKILVEAVGSLVEPYRQTVLLAYFEGLSSKEIAERQTVAPGTVRGRLKTALELLREALDRRLGERGAWLPSVTDLARASGPGPSTAPSTAGAPQDGLASPRSATPSPATALAAPSAAGTLSAVVGLVVVVATGAVAWKVTHRSGARDPAVSKGLIVPPSRPSAVAASSGLSIAVVPRPDPNGPCKIATKADTPTAKACAEGGRSAAKKLMKRMVKQANAQGDKLTCARCHENLDNYELTENAIADYAKLEEIWKAKRQ